MPINNPDYAYSNSTFEDVLDFAYRINGLDPSAIIPNTSFFAKRALNSRLTSWINDGVLQFLQTTTLVKLQNNVIRYPLPSQFSDVLDLNLAAMGRQRTGLPYSNSGGSAALAFDGDLTTACTQTSVNGTIGINFSVEVSNPRIVDYFGVLSASASKYTITLEGSNDNINWVPLYVMDRPYTFSGILSENYISWFQVDAPQPFMYLQIRETNGAILNIAELYFMSYSNSIDRSSVGRSSYMQINRRNVPSFPNTFTVEKGNDHLTLAFFGAPTDLPDVQDFTPNMAYFNYVLMRVTQYPFNINFLSYPININRLFIPALEYFLAADVALLHANLPLNQTLMAEAQAKFNAAKGNNSDLGGMNLTITRQ